MFGIFKKKSEKEKLQIKYQQLKEKAFKMSKINRKESDKLESKAQEILDMLEEADS
tara:strand:- start:16811 stop:16978 length:168 start_codon:yes stop_codon:yes gene_type:complete